VDSANAIQQLVEDVLSHINGGGINNESFNHLPDNEQFVGWIRSLLMNFLESGSSQKLVADLKNALGYILTHYAELNKRDLELASALGACTCWGEVEHCEICHGEGSPGWMMPDQEMFLRMVVPALLTVNRSKAKNRAHTQDEETSDE